MQTTKRKTTRKSKSNRGWPSGKPKAWPEDVAEYKKALLDQFRRENPDLHGAAREKKRRAFMFARFWKYTLPDHTTIEAGKALITFVEQEARQGEDPKKTLRELLAYIKGDK